MRSVRRHAALLILAAPLLKGAEVNRSWDRLVQTVQVGKKIVVTRMNSATAEGKLLSITADSVSVEVNKQAMAIAKSNVFRLRYADIRRKRTLIGMAIGAASGFLVGAVSAESPPDRAPLGTIAAILGVGIGAGAGAAIPIGPPLYEAADSTRLTVPAQPTK